MPLSAREEVLHKSVLAFPVELTIRAKTNQQKDRVLRNSVKKINQLYENNNGGKMEEGCRYILMEFLKEAIPIMESGPDFFNKEEYYELAVKYADHLTRYYEEFQN